MRWYKTALRRTASVTFVPADSANIAQPMDLMDLAFDLSRHARYVSRLLGDQAGVTMDDIAPDGDDDFHEPLGTINFYIPQTRWVATPTDDDPYRGAPQPIPDQDKVTPEQISSIVAAYNKDKAGSVVLQAGPAEVSAMRGIPVVRVSVVKNDTTNYTEVPEANMANGNARMILEMLAQHGLPVDPDELYGSFSVDDYWTAKGLIEQEAIQSRTRPPSSDKGMGAFYKGLGAQDPRPQPQNPWEEDERRREDEAGPTVYDQGMTPERILGYLGALDRIAQWIHDQKLPNRTISFG